jgi:hypothetical protein
VWKACERFGMKPWSEFDPLPLTAKENLIAYSQIRDIEEAEENGKFLSQLAKVLR